MDNDTAGALIVIALWILALAFAIVIYLLPYVVGKSRRVATRGWLLFANIVFGWTLIGWAVCMLWGVLGQTDDQVRFYRLGSR